MMWRLRHALKAIDLLVHPWFSSRCKTVFVRGMVMCEHDGCSWSLSRETWRLW